MKKISIDIQKEVNMFFEKRTRQAIVISVLMTLVTGCEAQGSRYILKSSLIEVQLEMQPSASSSFIMSLEIENGSNDTIGIDTTSALEVWKENKLSLAFQPDLSYQRQNEFVAIPPEGVCIIKIPLDKAMTTLDLSFFVICDINLLPIQLSKAHISHSVDYEQNEAYVTWPADGILESNYIVLSINSFDLVRKQGLFDVADKCD
ncbi:MAG: hypothetical protein IPL46_30325 [Saprospiraceae bacterium]|nr:hypothetical protein [Saprospiraceae bacterium]